MVANQHCILQPGLLSAAPWIVSAMCMHFFLSLVRWSVLSERERRSLYACRRIERSKEIGKRNRPKGGGGHWEETHLFQKQFTQPSFSVFFLLLLRQRKKYDAGRGILLYLFLGQPSCQHTLPRDHFLQQWSAQCYLGGWPMGWVLKPWDKQMKQPLPMSHFQLKLQELADGMQEGRIPALRHPEHLIRDIFM